MVSVPVPEGGSRSQLVVRTAPRLRHLLSKTNNDRQIKFELLQLYPGLTHGDSGWDQERKQEADRAFYDTGIERGR